eukprot:13133413-Ditylum_brightwellii.AAC.1
MRKVMITVGITFEILENDIKTSDGWSKVTGHIIFDVKMDFMKKARWLLDGHKTPELALSSQRHYIIYGAKFGLENIGKQVLIRRALYGRKFAGKDFCNHLRPGCMDATSHLQ